MFDVIGDVHGQGGKLRALLARMGYMERHGCWRAPQGRQAVFVGDLIDRGPEQLEVLDIVRRMVDAGQAHVVLGNHEFNAIAFTVRAGGDFLRPRTPQSLHQHEAFLGAVGIDTATHREWVNWFRTLPMALDLGGLRIVHAWWDDAARRRVDAARGGPDGLLDGELVTAMFTDPTLKAARKLLTCGVEMELPADHWITDKEGHRHPDVRLAVWRHGRERLRDIAIVPRGSEHAVPDIPIPEEHRLPPVAGAPILFGHHWFNGEPRLEGPRVACLDWSAARDGPLVAYRWGGEAELVHEHLVASDG